MKITQLKLTQHGRRVNVFIDNEWSLTIAYPLITDFGLYRDKEVTDEEIQKMKAKDAELVLYQKLLHFISIRPRSSYEINKYIKEKVFRKKYNKSIIEHVQKKLRKEGYVNDSNFTQWWIEMRLERGGMGKNALVQELKQKGIKKELILEIIQRSGITAEKEKEIALSIGSKKAKILKDLHDPKNKQRFFSFLIRKGFSYSVTLGVYQKLRGGKSMEPY